MCNFLQSVLIPALQQRGLHQASSSCCWMWSRSAFSATIQLDSLSCLYKDQIFLSYSFCSWQSIIWTYHSLTDQLIRFYFQSFWSRLASFFRLYYQGNFCAFVNDVCLESFALKRKNISAYPHVDVPVRYRCFFLFKAMLCGQTLKRLRKKSAWPTLSSSNLP